MSRLGVRRRLLLAVLATAVLAVGGLVAGFNLVLRATLNGNARDQVRSRADAKLGGLRVERGRLRVEEAPDEGATSTAVWVFSGTRLIEGSPAPLEVERAVRRLVGGKARYATISSTDTLVYAVPVVSGTRVGTVVAGISLAPYEETRSTALLASLVFGGVVVVLLGAVVWWLVGASLRPVVRMTRQAAAWSERDLDHRFALGQPHDELTELAATLDGLLDRLAASLRRERRFSAELSHELRTPLAVLITETEVALRRERRPEEYRRTLELIQEGASRLARTVDALVAAARHEAGGRRGRADAEQVAYAAASACTALADERGIDLEVDPPGRVLRVGVDADLAERIVQPVIENACRHASNRVRVTMERVDSTVRYAVEDDGPGVQAPDRDRIFEPGVRGEGSAGAGLGLSLARRLARSVDGDVEVGTAQLGARFVVRLPTG